jgi:hypothetical protein
VTLLAERVCVLFLKEDSTEWDSSTEPFIAGDNRRHQHDQGPGLAAHGGLWRINVLTMNASVHRAW